MRYKCAGSHTGTALAIGFGAALISSSVLSDVWVFAPSVSFDQRFDDNFFLATEGDGAFSATRGVGELGVSREAQNYVFEGLARVDALVTTQSEIGPEELDSNQFIAFNFKQVTPRSRYGINFDYTVDTPSRDITADITEESASATDTGLVVTDLVAGELTQSLLNNVAREQFKIEPNFEYDITRRLAFDASLSYTDVSHETPAAQDVIYQRFLELLELGVRTTFLEYDEVTIEDVGVFTVDGELDDFSEVELSLGLDYKLSPISSTSVSYAFSRVTTNTEFPLNIVAFEEREPDSDVRQILRVPRYDSVSVTNRITLGYERFLTSVLRWSVNVGYYETAADVLLIEEDRVDLSTPVPVGTDETDGYIANTRLAYDAGRTQYRVSFAADVQPSSAGPQVETNELAGELTRELGRRLDFSFNARAFEPDSAGALTDSEFARRFISFEPRIDWQINRNWTVTAAYRYRRQKSRAVEESADSNALLFGIKYNPPSKIREAAREFGL